MSITTDPGDEVPRVAAAPVTSPGLPQAGHSSRALPVDEAVRTGPEILIWRRAFPGALDQAAEARRLTRFLLGGTPFADDAELVVGELAGNAVRHTRSGSPGGHFTVEIILTSPRREPLGGPAAAASVLVTVYDLGGAGVPRFGGHGQADVPCAEGGRGLAIVTALAERTGFQGAPATGHRVWAYLARRP
ncbi:ATP-binding protein [Sphaerisporangium album]|uniref:ATP-binding protein n=1 Tax=Sphaerisporangium album TaxID=509200 RepID=UPI001C68DE28|nr:ATP-binding protein [Sphaerisporangium album]